MKWHHNINCAINSLNAYKLAIIVCVVLAITQTAFMILSAEVIHIYTMVLRPLVYASLAMMIYFFIGFDKRLVPNAYNANVAAIISIIMLGIAFLVLSVLFGLGINVMVASTGVVIRHLWEYGLIIILGELMRYTLIKSTSKQKGREGIIIALTIALAYSHFGTMRIFGFTGAVISSIFFESIFRPLVISVVVSYFAVKGTFFSVILISFVFMMLPYVMPVLPNVSPLIFSLIISMLAFTSAAIHYLIPNGNNHRVRLREKKMIKYSKKSLFSYITSATIVIIAVAFFGGLLPIYPVAILTNSMEPTFSRGSLVLIERVPSEQAFYQVGEGYIIHFIGPAGNEFIHRVVDFRLNAEGERQYITQGDAYEIPDRLPISQDNVLGIARVSLPFFGYPSVVVRAIIGTYYN
ncbi:MAG: signal peptidase I [Defluviitaleaceae bacterium]|nr:signal peptidase I [Defluviitaleaceae bacterium]